jgi:uncharacterized lipoprotein NlpE involved in copper resistance
MHIWRCVVALVFVMTALGQADNKFVGVTKCKACHSVEKMGGLAYKVWEKTPHAKAYQSLLGDAAPSESPECLKCHVSGGGAAKNIEAGFKKEDGVTCEACHGAASAWLMVHNKKDDASKAKAKEAGLMLGDKTGKACQACHNDENPSPHKEFVMKDMWAKIEHGLPPKK